VNAHRALLEIHANIRVRNNGGDTSAEIVATAEKEIAIPLMDRADVSRVMPEEIAKKHADSDFGATTVLTDAIVRTVNRVTQLPVNATAPRDGEEDDVTRNASLACTGHNANRNVCVKTMLIAIM